MGIPTDDTEDQFGKLHVEMGVYWYYLAREDEVLIATQISPGMETLTGRTRMELQAPDAWARLIHEEDLSKARDRRDQLLAPVSTVPKSPNYMKFRIYGAPDVAGTRQTILIGDYCYQDVNANGQVVGLFGIARNITGLEEAIKNRSTVMIGAAVKEERQRCAKLQELVLAETSSAITLIQRLLTHGQLLPKIKSEMSTLQSGLRSIMELCSRMMTDPQ